MTEGFFVTVDVGGTNTRVALVDTTFNVIGFDSFPTTPNATTSLTNIESSINKLIRDRNLTRSALKGSGMGVAGLVRNGKLVKDVRIALAGSDLSAFLTELGSDNVVVVNDAVAQAAGEYNCLNPPNNVSPLVYLTFGTGIGSAVLIDGKPLVGNRGSSSEMGHLVVWPDGPPCKCGARGCCEALIGGEAIQIRYGMSASQLFSSSQHDEILSEISNVIAQMLGAIYRIFDPQLVVFGGGIGPSYVGLMPRISQRLNLYLSSAMREGLCVRAAKLGDHAGLIGVAHILASSSPAE
jgi:glucokinase